MKLVRVGLGIEADLTARFDDIVAIDNNRRKRAPADAT